MAYVAPNSIIELFGDVGLSDNYTDTYYFPSENRKNAYFTALHKVGVSLTPLSYLREERNQVKVQLPMSQIYSARYMRFKNTSFENKWFYAFVKNVEYINNECSCIYYELDPLMTWMGTFTLGKCFIERQHTLRDGIGENIAREDLDLGPYVCEGYSSTGRFTDYTICIFQSEPIDPEADAIYYSGLFSGLYLYVATTATSAIDHINAMIGANKGDSIVFIEMLPSHFVPDPAIGSNAPTMDRFIINKPYTNFNYGDFTYTPRNKKLFTYPFKKLDVYNTEGESGEYKWELFNPLPDAVSGATCAFTMRGAAHIQTEISMIPEGYKGLDFAYAERLTMSNFVKCAWSSDAFKAYLAQAQSSLPVTLLSSGLNMMASGLTGNPIPGAIGLNSSIREISSLLAMKANEPSMPAQSKGSQSNDLMCALKTKDFYFYRMCITKNYAMMIDDYFDMFGYAIREHGIPNMNARPHWTYVKTIGCQVNGAIPADDASDIENLFNNGIRFWNSADNIGDYSYNNAPV